MICVILGLKTLFLLLVCDFGRGYYLCAQYILSLASNSNFPLDSDVLVEDLCPEFTWACGMKFLLVFTVSYLIIDIVIYLMFFLAEEKYSSVPKEKHVLRFADGHNVLDKNGEVIFNFWYEGAVYKTECKPCLRRRRSF